MKYDVQRLEADSHAAYEEYHKAANQQYGPFDDWHARRAIENDLFAKWAMLSEALKGVRHGFVGSHDERLKMAELLKQYEVAE
jgi:hypothetical protein